MQVHDIKCFEDADDIADMESELYFHQDLLYYEAPPGIVALNCIRFVMGLGTVYT